MSGIEGGEGAGEGRRTPRSLATRAALVTGGYVVVAIVAIAGFVPPFPRSAAGWGALLLLAPPLYLCGEWLGEKLAGNWGERSRLAKVVKATLFVVVAVTILVLVTVFQEA